MSDYPARAVDHHTLTGVFMLSGGGHSTTYIDLRAALLCRFCSRGLTHWYAEQIAHYVPVATGSFGALLLGCLADRGIFGVLWNPKGHGIEWSGYLPNLRVVLVDDVATTGSTLSALRAAVESAGGVVVGEVVSVDRRAI